MLDWLWPIRFSREPLIHVSTTERERRRDRVALMFVLDASYVVGLKTLLYSLRHAYDPEEVDVVVISNDPGLSADPFIRNVANEVLILSDRQIARFSRLKKKRGLRTSLRHPVLGRYTFLKFLAYTDLGYRGRVLMDTDMLCVSPHFRLTELAGDWDFAAVRSLGGRSIGVDGKGIEGRTLSPPEMDSALAGVRSRLTSEWGDNCLHNGGLTYAGKAMLNEKVVNGLLKLAEKPGLRGEQSTVQAYMVETVPVSRRKAFPITYNFCQLPAIAIGETNFRRLLPEIRILHYNRKKPWLHRPTQHDWLDRYWLDAREEAEAWIAERSS